jgi:hypothetical protein
VVPPATEGPHNLPPIKDLVSIPASPDKASCIEVTEKPLKPSREAPLNPEQLSEQMGSESTEKPNIWEWLDGF